MNKRIFYRFCCSFVDEWWCLEDVVDGECWIKDLIKCLVEVFDCSGFFIIDGDCGDGERRIKVDWWCSSSLFVGGADDETVLLTRGIGAGEE